LALVAQIHQAQAQTVLILCFLALPLLEEGEVVAVVLLVILAVLVAAVVKTEAQAVLEQVVKVLLEEVPQVEILVLVAVAQVPLVQQGQQA
jgi:hypothetical protein